MMDFLDIELSSSFQKFLLSSGLVVIQIIGSILCYLIARMIENDELTKLLKWSGFWLCVFALSRLLASLADKSMGYEIYYVSYAVNYAFWTLIVWIINKCYLWLRKGFYLDQRRKEIKKNKTLLATADFSEQVSLGFERQHRVSSMFRQFMVELKFQESMRNSIG